MTGPLTQLAGEDLRALALALRIGRLLPPFGNAAVRRILPSSDAEPVAASLRSLADEGFAPTHLARTLELLAIDRASRPQLGDLVELVWTGPEAAGAANRDTGVVVRELFTEARRSVMVAGYAIYQGPMIFRALAERMDADPTVNVRMYLDVRRDHGESSAPSEIVSRFARKFAERVWPGTRLPEIFYDPRSLDLDPSRRASLHAKCVVIDGERSLVSSANFTEAAQLRNIEAGILIRSTIFARELVRHFDTLAATGALLPIALPTR